MIDSKVMAEAVVSGDQRALARALSAIERRTPGYRELVGELYEHADGTGTGTETVGITGSPGTGKSTIVDRIVDADRRAGRTVGVLAVDPASPYSGGAVLGDRIRLQSRRADDGVFFRSMSSRGRLGGLAPATGDAIVALDAYGVDRIIVETVGAGQSEVDVVGMTDTVVLVMQPGSGDDVQLLKAGILEIGDVFVINKGDLPGVDRLRKELTTMLGEASGTDWYPPVVETVAIDHSGINDLLEAIDEHREYLAASGILQDRRRERIATTIRRIVSEDLEALVEATFDRRGGIERYVDTVATGESDPYSIATDMCEPVSACLEEILGVTPEETHRNASSSDECVNEE